MFLRAVRGVGICREGKLNRTSCCSPALSLLGWSTNDEAIFQLHLTSLQPPHHAPTLLLETCCCQGTRARIFALQKENLPLLWGLQKTQWASASPGLHVAGHAAVEAGEGAGGRVLRGRPSPSQGRAWLVHLYAAHGHQRHQRVNGQICAFLTGAKALAAESSQLLLPERRR